MSTCEHLADFLRTEKDVIRRHLDEHIFLRGMPDRNEAMASFIHDYGWLMRELYCTRICPDRANCRVAGQLQSTGDLLRDHQKAGAA